MKNKPLAKLFIELQESNKKSLSFLKHATLEHNKQTSLIVKIMLQLVVSFKEGQDEYKQKEGKENDKGT